MARIRRPYAFSLIIVLLVAMTWGQVAYAHPTEKEHDAELEKVLFNGKDPGNRAAVEALEKAAYLCIDFSGRQAKGETALNILRDFGVGGLPASSSDIYMPGGGQHRQYTHRGWDDQANYFINDGNMTKEEYEAHWESRKSVLLQTSYMIFGYSPPPAFLAWSPLRDDEAERKYNSFCALVYYVHVLGDYDEDDNYNKFNGKTNGRKIAFARPHPREGNIDIFYELDKHLAVLFEDQKDTLTYKQLMNDLNSLAGEARALSGGSGVDSDEKFNKAHEQVEELLALLCGTGTHANRVHELLMGEEFFTDAFPGLQQASTSSSSGWLDELLSRLGFAA